MSPQNVSSTFNYLSRLPLYDTEKSYTLSFESPDASVPHSNAIYDSIEDVHVEDVRGKEAEFSIDRNSFHLAHLPCSLTDEQFEDREMVISRYLPAVVEMLLRELSAVRIQVWDFVIRRQDPQFPNPPTEPLKYAQPTAVAHIDTNQWNTTRLIGIINPNGSLDLKKMRHQWLNIWKPIRGPVENWPLALCDPNSLDIENDLRVHDVVFDPDESVSEAFQLHYSQSHKWYYINNQTLEEAWIFLQSDSRTPYRGVPHSSFAHPLYKANSSPRHSIEVRVLAYFED